ncbi:hypothetical protein B0J14DRAFT_81963 [Halenospora varia]|nr:hypothetical protein B0J14DRAFT_81963 [Halenospora varia]
MSSKIPPLLESYLALPPEASLILLTSVLGASTNWLVLRFLHSTLLNGDASIVDGSEDDTKIVLVSFMRDFAFWKENAKRLGLDLEKAAAKRRFAFVDGLSGLFLPKQQKQPVKRPGEKRLVDPGLASISGEISNAIKDLGEAGEVVLVVDQLDLLLATAGGQVGAVDITDLLTGLREEVHSVVVTLSADYPLVSTQQTLLETNHAAFLLNVAHQADFTMSLRLLDSGTARDVSGVIRVTTGDQEMHGSGLARKIEERELLYFVGGDGGVRVFERGQ